MSAKLLYLARRNPRLSREEFPKRWRKHAASVGGGAPEVLSEIRSTHYCLVRPSREVLPASSDEYDGVGLVRLHGLASIPAMHHHMVTNEITMADELRTFDTYVTNFGVFCAEEVVRDGELAGAALFHFVRRSPGVAPSDFSAAWREAIVMMSLYAVLSTTAACFCESTSPLYATVGRLNRFSA